MMKHLKVKNIYRNNGITLVALVITIIILLILAGIAIASLTGDNGLFARANQARKETLTAQEDELRRLTQLEATTHLEDYEYEDESGKKVTVPAQCAVSQVEGENTLADGLVIIDANGNEWVWVEVPRTTDVYSTTTLSSITDVDNITDDQCTTIYNDLATYAGAYRDSNYSDTFYSKDQAGFEDADAYNEAKNNMLRSVYTYGGFWIGRYEVGDADATASNTTRTDTTGTSNTAVIKANQIPYNWITCKQAQELATRLSTGGKTSSLMFGIQWDLTCKFLEVKTDLNEDDIKEDSTNWGNYYNNPIILSQGKYNTSPDEADNPWLDIVPGNKTGTMLLTTGASEDTNKMNIYDFAGNVSEWTLETYTSSTILPCARRGGNFYDIGSDYPASNRNNFSTTYSNFYFGFRPSLY